MNRRELFKRSAGSPFLLLGLTAGIISSCQKETELLPDPDALSDSEESNLKAAKSKESSGDQQVGAH